MGVCDERPVQIGEKQVPPMFLVNFARHPLRNGAGVYNPLTRFMGSETAEPPSDSAGKPLRQHASA